ncbi:hypothetical protein ACTHS6_10740 [Neisseria sp. P0016.S006]
MWFKGSCGGVLGRCLGGCGVFVLDVGLFFVVFVCVGWLWWWCGGGVWVVVGGFSLGFWV